MQPTSSTPTTTKVRSHDLPVLVFGMQAHAVGSDRLMLTSIDSPIAAADVLTLIAETHPDLSASIGASRLAVNHEFATPETLIHEGDEVALVGLISGG